MNELFYYSEDYVTRKEKGFSKQVTKLLNRGRDTNRHYPYLKNTNCLSFHRNTKRVIDKIYFNSVIKYNATDIIIRNHPSMPRNNAKTSMFNVNYSGIFDVCEKNKISASNQNVSHPLNYSFEKNIDVYSRSIDRPFTCHSTYGLIVNLSKLETKQKEFTTKMQIINQKIPDISTTSYEEFYDCIKKIVTTIIKHLEESKEITKKHKIPRILIFDDINLIKSTVLILALCYFTRNDIDYENSIKLVDECKKQNRDIPYFCLGMRNYIFGNHLKTMFASSK